MPGPRLHIAGPYIAAGTRRTGAFRGVDSPEEARRFVDEWAGKGATWFKVMSGPRDVLRWTIDAAHARGLRVTGHLCAVTFAEAAEMGIDALQHGFITDSEHVPGKQPDVCPRENQRAQADVDVASPAVQASIRRIVAGGTPVVSTLGVYESFVPGRARLDPRAMEMLAPAHAPRGGGGDHAQLAVASFNVPERLLMKMMRWERDFVAAGGLLGAGSDPWGTGFLPGFGNLRNYELLVEAGFTPEQAIRHPHAERRAHPGRGGPHRLHRAGQDRGPGGDPRRPRRHAVAGLRGHAGLSRRRRLRLRAPARVREGEGGRVLRLNPRDSIVVWFTVRSSLDQNSPSRQCQAICCGAAVHDTDKARHSRIIEAIRGCGISRRGRWACSEATRRKLRCASHRPVRRRFRRILPWVNQPIRELRVRGRLSRTERGPSPAPCSTRHRQPGARR